MTREQRSGGSPNWNHYRIVYKVTGLNTIGPIANLMAKRSADAARRGWATPSLRQNQLFGAGVMVTASDWLTTAVIVSPIFRLVIDARRAGSVTLIV